MQTQSARTFLSRRFESIRRRFGAPSAASLLLRALPALLPLDRATAFDVVGGDLDTLKVHVGTSALDEFGNAVCGPGDLDGDGVPDYVIAAHKTGHPLGDEGMIAAYSGADHSTLWIVEGENDDDRFGHALAAIEDIDGDGVREVAVSAIYF